MRIRKHQLSISKKEKGLPALLGTARVKSPTLQSIKNTQLGRCQSTKKGTTEVLGSFSLPLFFF